jgi:ligand-binding sensor domain-containing protein
VLASLLAAPPPARALDPRKALQQCTVQTWRTRDGMPGTWVRSIVQTDEGYLWIATYGGVVRYDGEQLHTLEAPGPLGRLFDTMGLKRQTDGSLLMVPSVGGPACLDDKGLHDCALEGTSLPPGTRLVDVHRQSDGVSWLAARAALYRHPTGSKRPLQPIALPWSGEFRLTFVHRDRQGRLWLGSSNGLLVGRPDDRGVRLDFLQGPGGPVTTGVTALFESPSGQLWIAGNDGLLRVGADGRSTLLGPKQGWPVGRAWQLTEDRHGNLWVAHASGLLRLQAGRLTLFDARDGLPEGELTAVFEDREGGLWVGSRSAGLAQFTDRTVEMGHGPPSLHDSRLVESITEDPSGAMWFGTRAGLVRWQGGVERLFTAREGLPSSAVLAVTPAAGGGLWLGTSHGLARLREGSGGVTIERWLSAEARIEALLVDPDGSLLLTVNGRLARLPATATARPAAEADRALVLMGVADDFPLGYVRGMGRDASGTLYVAGVTAVGRLAGDIIVDSGLPRELRTSRAMHTDARGRLWITTGAGLVRLGAGPPQLFGSRQGISDRHLFQVQTDGRGHVWVGSSRGILRLSERELDEVAAGRRPRVYPQSLDVSDRRRDVVSTNVRQPGSVRDRLGRVWFPTEHGPLLIDPARLPLNARPPAVRIDKAVVDGRPVLRDQDNQLPPGPGNLEFRFSAVTLLEPHKSLHRYMLEGFDGGWIEAGSRRAAYYTNIPPGRYRFRVQGSNADGVWNERGDALQFRLRPHFYRTGWFYSLLAALLLASVASLWRMRVRSLRREYLAAFAERSRVARELHDTLLQGMSAVGLQLRGLRRRLASEAPGAARELEQLETTITSSLQETRRFLSDLREQPGPAADLGVALERLAGRLTAGHAARSSVKVEGTPVPLPHDATGDLFRIASEAVTNAVKHAAPTQIDVGLN